MKMKIKMFGMNNKNNNTTIRNVCKVGIHKIKEQKENYMTKGKMRNTKHKWFNINEYMYLVQFSSFNTHRDNRM